MLLVSALNISRGTKEDPNGRIRPPGPRDPRGLPGQRQPILESEPFPQLETQLVGNMGHLEDLERDQLKDRPHENKIEQQEQLDKQDKHGQMDQLLDEVKWGKQDQFFSK